jgi:hypothetical protein
MTVVYVDATVEVDILDYLGDIDTDDLIEELEARGFRAIDDFDTTDELTKDDIFLLMGLVYDSKPGSQEYFIREKLGYILDQKRSVDG